MFPAILLLCLATVTIADYGPIRVSLYFESLCGPCQDFTVEQLYPTFKKVGQIMDIDLVPYGNAEYKVQPNGSISFECQHGPLECYINQIYSCLFDQYTDTEFRLNFLNCTEHGYDPTRDGIKKCAKASGVDFDSLDNCATQLKGQQLEYKMALKTDALVPSHEYVPWILINDVHSEADQIAAQTDLLKLICARYSGPAPEACSQYRDTKAIQSDDRLDVSFTNLH